MFLFLGIVCGTPTCYVIRYLLNCPVAKSLGDVCVTSAWAIKLSIKVKNVLKIRLNQVIKRSC